MSIDLRQCTDALIYEGIGNLMLGRIDKFEITDGRSTTEVEHKTLGSVGMVELPGRPLKAIKGKIVQPTMFKEMDRTLIHPGILHDWQMHKKIDVNDETGYSESLSHTIVWHARFRTIGDPGTSSELGEKDGQEYNITIPYLRVFVEGESTAIWELNAFTNIYEVNGRPVWRR